MPPPYPLPVIAGTVRAAVTGTTSRGTKWANILHFRHGTIPSEPVAADIDALDVKLKKLYDGTPYSGGASITSMCNTGTLFTQVAYTPLDGLSPTTIKSWGITGHDSTESMPPMVSVCVSLYTAKRGKRYRGRCYMPPFSEGQAIAGAFAPIAQGNLLSQWNGFLVDLPSISWALVVATYGHSITKDGTEHTWTPEANNVSLIAINPTFDTQRGRIR